MQVVVTGGTGFLGAPLVEAIRANGDEVTVLTRGAARRPGEVSWQPTAPSAEWTRSIERADAVINLAGEPIAAGRWTSARKRALLASRLAATRAIVDVLRAAGSPAALLSGSAIGYYGTPADVDLDESSPAGHDFLGALCREWEDEARRAADRSRVVLLRSGLVLGPGGGVLERLARPFRFFVGGPLGSGRQVMSWIHRDDWIALVLWALGDRSLAGPLNLTAPNPVTNRELADALGRVLHRPAFMPAPAFALRLLLGEMADSAILSGQRVLPRVALEHGFAFQYSTVDDALRAIYRTG